MTSATHCRCCRALLAPAERGPLCDRCAGGACRRGRVHRVVVRTVDGGVRRVVATRKEAR